MSPEKKTANRAEAPMAAPPRTGDPCPGPSEKEGEPCGRPVVAHGLCRGHDRQEQAGQTLRPIRIAKKKSQEGAVYRWGISWSSPQHADAVTAMARDAGRGERDFIRHVLEELAEAEGRLGQKDAPAPPVTKRAPASPRRRR